MRRKEERSANILFCFLLQEYEIFDCIHHSFVQTWIYVDPVIVLKAKCENDWQSWWKKNLMKKEMKEKISCSEKITTKIKTHHQHEKFYSILLEPITKPGERKKERWEEEKGRKWHEEKYQTCLIQFTDRLLRFLLLSSFLSLSFFLFLSSGNISNNISGMTFLPLSNDESKRDRKKERNEKRLSGMKGRKDGEKEMSGNEKRKNLVVCGLSKS